MALLTIAPACAFGQTSNVDQLKDAAYAGQPQAQFRLATYYRDGSNGLPKDAGKAFDWFQQAAAKCYAPAQDAVGVAYLTGSGPQSDLRNAARYFRLAAAQHNPQGLFHLAQAFFDNRAYAQDADEDSRSAPGCPTLKLATASIGVQLHADDPEERAKAGFGFMQQAAQSGMADAQYAVGDALEHGKGTKVDVKQAESWYRKAAAQGQSDAAASLSRLQSNSR